MFDLWRPESTGNHVRCLSVGGGAVPLPQLRGQKSQVPENTTLLPCNRDGLLAGVS